MLKNALIVTATLAVVLGITAYFVVFYTSGSYIIPASNIPLTTPSSTASSTLTLPTSTASSSVSSTTSTSTSSSGTGGDSGNYQSMYSSPALTWADGNEDFALTGASLSNNQLTFSVQVMMGNVSECVPINLRMLTDESGRLAGPNSLQFTFPESGNCNGAPGATYNNEPVVFNVNPSAFPLFFTTGGKSNLFFQVSTTTFGGIQIQIPQRNG